KINHNDESKDEIYGIISKRYDRLGSVSSHEASVMVLFSILIILWIFRDPKFIPGWATVLGFKSKVGDSTVAMVIVFLMFFLPSNFRDLGSRRILEWKTVQAKFPWGVIFLLGAGSSLAQGAQKDVDADYKPPFTTSSQYLHRYTSTNLTLGIVVP
ncbi:Solute carrier family 13 member 5, partial [Araneus ventricosus]